MQDPVCPFVNRNALIAVAFAGSDYQPIDVMGDLDSIADAHGSQSGLHCMSQAQPHVFLQSRSESGDVGCSVW